MSAPKSLPLTSSKPRLKIVAPLAVPPASTLSAAPLLTVVPMAVPAENTFCSAEPSTTVLEARPPLKTFWMPSPTKAPVTTAPEKMFCAPPLNTVPLLNGPLTVPPE
jgi:hypothetical protein